MQRTTVQRCRSGESRRSRDFPPPPCSSGSTVGFRSTRVCGSRSSTATCRAIFSRSSICCDTVPGRSRKSTQPGTSGLVELSPFEFLDRLATHRYWPGGQSTSPTIEAAVRDAREVLVHPRTNHTECLGSNGGENRCVDFRSSRQMGAVRGPLFGRPVPPSIQPGKEKA